MIKKPEKIAAKTLFWLLLLLILPFFLFGSKTSADTTDDLQSVNAQRSVLEKQLAAMETQIAQYEKDLAKIGAQKNTLANLEKDLRNKKE